MFCQRCRDEIDRVEVITVYCPGRSLYAALAESSSRSIIGVVLQSESKVHVALPSRESQYLPRRRWQFPRHLLGRCLSIFIDAGNIVFPQTKILEYTHVAQMMEKSDAAPKPSTFKTKSGAEVDLICKIGVACCGPHERHMDIEPTKATPTFQSMPPAGMHGFSGAHHRDRQDSATLP